MARVTDSSCSQDVKTLDLLRCVAKGVSVKIFSEQHGRTRLTENMLADFSAARPYAELDDVHTTGNVFHDRYIYLDFGTTATNDENIHKRVLILVRGIM